MCPPWQWDFCLAIFQNFSRKHFSQDVYNPILSQPLGMPEWDESECGFIIAAKLLSRVRLFVTPQTTAHQSSLSFTISQNLLKLMSIESVMPSKYLILYHPLQSFPVSASFLMSQLFTSSGQENKALPLFPNLTHPEKLAILYDINQKEAWIHSSQGSQKAPF